MNWLIWLVTLLAGLHGSWMVFRRWRSRRKIKRLTATLEAARRELAALEALTAEDRAWLDRQWQNPAHE